jgi:hypothetical protein
MYIIRFFLLEKLGEMKADALSVDCLLCQRTDSRQSHLIKTYFHLK